MGALSRRKGASAERIVARRLSVATGHECRRQLAECRDGNVGDIDGHPWLAVQVKCGRRPPIYDAVRQARQAAGASQMPLAVIRRDGDRSRPVEWLAVLDLDDLCHLLEALPSDWRPLDAVRRRG